MVFDTAPLSETEFQYLAWYTDVTHEIKAITSGVRLVFTFNLCLEEPDTFRIPPTIDDDPAVVRVKQALCDWKESSCSPSQPYFLVYFLEHK